MSIQKLSTATRRLFSIEVVGAHSEGAPGHPRHFKSFGNDHSNPIACRIHATRPRITRTQPPAFPCEAPTIAYSCSFVQVDLYLPDRSRKAAVGYGIVRVDRGDRIHAHVEPFGMGHPAANGASDAPAAGDLAVDADGERAARTHLGLVDPERSGDPVPACVQRAGTPDGELIRTHCIVVEDRLAVLEVEGIAAEPPALRDQHATSVRADIDIRVDGERLPHRVRRGILVQVAERGAIRSQTIRSASIFLPGAKPPIGEISIGLRLDSSDDGVTWRPVASLDVAGVPTTVSFAPVVARRFRVVVTGRKPDAGNTLQRSAKIGTLLLSPDARVDHAETKAGFATALDYFAFPTPADETEVAPDRVIDITQRMRPDGTLDWVPPKGQWRILRLGTSLLGTRNHPATLEATGLEVDKYDGPAVRRYLDTYLGAYRDTVGAAMIGEHGIRALLTDSSEVGAANWTPRMVEHFKALRGYDPTPWLPALTGVLVGTRAQSDAFLFDFRRTLADLLASEHYGTIAAVAHENGLKLYGEALEDHRPMLGDDMAMRSHTDVPMAAMWTPDVNRPIATYVADIKGAASVAHLYGQNLVAAESLTSANKPWAFGPSDLRPVIDLEFATGVNRPVIHTSVHQPLDDKIPGLSLFYFGQFFNCHESWAEMARPWMDYMARNSVMLQRGRNVADVAYFYGEEAPLTGLYGDTAVADAPTRYAYDFANADVVTTLLSVDHGDLVAKSGARYKLLYLGGSSRRMTLPMLRRIADLVREGATVVGPAPIGSPGLGGDTPEYDALIKILWPGAPVATVGQGRVIANGDVEAALGLIGVTPDFNHSKPHPETQILFVHRRLDDGEVYFVNNRQNLDEQVEARFRVTGKVPEIWHADTGKSEPVSYRIEGAETVVPLNFGPQDSFFVVFRKSATAAMLEVAEPTFTPVAALNGAWRVAFQANRGAPASITLPTLGSLSEQADPGVKYFSGIATYTKSFNLARNTPPGTPMMLDLGKVGVIAEVRVNGNLIGTVWHAPYRLDIGPALKRGRNMLDIRVADLWVNRLIGDAQPEAKKITFTTIPTYNAKSPLVPAGLIGPVRLFAPATAR